MLSTNILSELRTIRQIIESGNQRIVYIHNTKLNYAKIASIRVLPKVHQ